MEERYQFNAQLNYRQNFRKHGIDALFVYELADQDEVNFSGRRNDLIANNIDQFTGASAVDATAEGSQRQVARVSYVGLVGYNFAQKYMLETSFRYDASVNFAPGKRWGFFPAASVGWRVSEEPFFKKSLSFVNDFKLRGSVALVGNDAAALGAFQWLQAYDVAGNGAIFNQQTFGLEQAVLKNENITWEKSLSYNFGFDSELLSNRVSLKLDVFKRHTYDILGARQLTLPSTLGARLPDENYQEVDSRGFEIELGFNNKIGSSKNQINYYLRGNFGYATNEIVKVDEAANIRSYQSALGRPVGLRTNYEINGNGQYDRDLLFGLVATDILRTQADIDALPAGYTIMGAVPQLGMLNYRDIRGPNSDTPDGRITNDDREFLAKYSIPPMNFGLSLGGSWRAFSLDVLMQGVAGSKTMLPTAGRDIQARPEESSFRYWTDSWSPENPDGKYPGYRVTSTRTRFDPSTFWLVDNSFLRLKNVNVSYSLPKSLLARTGINTARVFFTGSNLLMLYSKNKIYDAEMNNVTSYPMMQTYSFGLNVGL
jgi:TonB-linked SusC/RagA family outer membrane protein